MQSRRRFLGFYRRIELFVQQLHADPDEFHNFCVSCFALLEVTTLVNAGSGNLRQIADDLGDVAGQLGEIGDPAKTEPEQVALTPAPQRRSPNADTFLVVGQQRREGQLRRHKLCTTTSIRTEQGRQAALDARIRGIEIPQCLRQPGIRAAASAHAGKPGKRAVRLGGITFRACRPQQLVQYLEICFVQCCRTRRTAKVGSTPRDDNSSIAPPEAQRHSNACRLTMGRPRLYICRMSKKEKSEAKDLFASELERLDKRIDELVLVCDRLKEENQSLRRKQETLMSERAGLLQKNEQVRARVEAMISRLKAMEHGT